MNESSTIYIPINAPINVDKINDQLPTINCNITFKIAVMATSSPKRLLFLIAGTKIAMKSAYKEILKLFVTITGKKSKTKTPITAPKILCKTRMKIPFQMKIMQMIHLSPNEQTVC